MQAPTRLNALAAAIVGEAADEVEPELQLRSHPTLTEEDGGKKTTPAMAAGVTNHVWRYRDIAALFD